MRAYQINEDWQIIPINVIHDVPCLGYIIRDNISKLNIAYLTDLGYSESLNIQGINVWIIECNHIRNEMELLLEQAINENSEKVAYFNRVLGDKGHLCLEDSCQVIKNNYGYGLKCVILCHISSSESDYKRFEDLYTNELKRLEIPINSDLKIYAINNDIRHMEIFDIVEENEWEKMELD